MPELIAKTRISYGTRRVQAGATFNVSKQDARVLVALGRAQYVTDEAAPEVMKEPDAAPDMPAAEVAAEPKVDAVAPVRRGRPRKVRD